MLTFGINNDNDLFLDSNGNIVLKKDAPALGDIYVNKAQTNRGELAYNTSKGIDYFNTVFGEPCYPDVFQNQLINELVETEETISVSGYSQTITDDVLNYKVNCKTSYGNIIING